jgi:hypothetical protein
MGEEAGGRREIAMEIGGPRNREDPRWSLAEWQV